MNERLKTLLLDESGPPPGIGGDTLATFKPRGAGQATSLVSSSSMLARPLLERGESHADRVGYSLERRIGEGGFGEVWQGLQKSLQRSVAIKRLKANRIDEARSQADTLRLLKLSFEAEALATAFLEHPNIVPVHDLGWDGDGVPFLAMKLVRGRAWDEMISEDFGSLTAAEYLARHIPILIGVGHAAAFAHARGIVHRDLKPSQVRLGEFGEIVLMDWGLAMVFDRALLAGAGVASDAIEILPTRESAPNPAGTIAFMAPEQTVRTAECIGPWTDVHALGGCLYYLLTGTPPNQGESADEAFNRARMGVVPAAQERAPGREIPVELAALAARAMRPSPEERPTAIEFIEGLRAYLAGAGRRAESDAILREVEHQTAGELRDYRAISELEGRVREAARLWAANPSLPRVEGAIATRLGELALRNGDLSLARLQIERSPVGHARARLAESVAAHEARLRRRDRQRRAALWAAALLLLASMGLGVLTLRAQTQSALDRSRSEADRLRAETARREAALSAESARFLDEVNRLRDAESRLVDLLQRDFPLPSSVDPQADAPSSPIAERELSRHLAALEDLRAERRRLTQSRRGGVPAEPYELHVLEGTRILRSSEDATATLAAYERYREASMMRPDRPEPHTGMGVAAARLDEGSSAVLHLTEATSRTIDIYGKGSRQYAQAIQLKAQAYASLSRANPEYVALYRESISVLSQITLDSALSIGVQLYEIGDTTRAIEFTSETLEAYESLGTSDRAWRALGQNNLGLFLMAVGRNREAVDRLRESYAIRAELLGPRHPNTIVTLDNLAMSLVEIGMYDEAEVRFREALAAREGEPADRRAQVANNFAAALFERGRRGEAREMWQRAFELIVQSRGTREHPDCAQILQNIAVAEHSLDRIAEARRDYEEALGIRVRLLGEEHPKTAETQTNYALLLSEVGEDARAEELFTKALASRERAFGPESLHVSHTLGLIADHLARRDRGAEAVPYLERALAIERTSRGPDHNSTIAAERMLGVLLARIERFHEADAQFRTAVRSSIRAFGLDHPVAVAAIRDWAALRARDGALDEAIELTRMSLGLSRAQLGDAHSTTRGAVGNLAGMLEEKPSSPTRDRDFLLLAALLDSASSASPRPSRGALRASLANDDLVTSALLTTSHNRPDLARRVVLRSAAKSHLVGVGEDSPHWTTWLLAAADRLGVTRELLAPGATPAPSPAADGTFDGTTVASWLAGAAPAVDWRAEFPSVTAWGLDAIEPAADAEARARYVRRLEELLSQQRVEK